MSKMIIDNIDFHSLENMRYWSFPNSWDLDKKKETVNSRIFSDEWLGAQKRDGAFYKFIKDEDGNMELLGRSKSVSGDYLNKIDWVPHLMPLFNELPNGTCLLGELYLPSNEQAKSTTSIMNCLKEKAIKRQEKEPLHYYIFDILAFEGKSYLDMPAEDRFENELVKCWRAYGESTWEWAEYFEGQELWNHLQNLLADGYEGVVITRKGALYQPGKRSSKDTLKVKKELQETIDCIMIGANSPAREYTGKEIETWPYWFDELKNEKILRNDTKDFEDTGTTIYKSYLEGAPVTPVTKNWFYGWAGSWKLGVYKNGKLVEIGNLSGITDEMKENWKDYVGKVCEITAMEIMSNAQGGYGLRHPKLVSIRSDKKAEECIYEQIF